MSAQRRLLIPLATAVVALFAIAAPAGAHYNNPSSKYCGFIVFEGSTDSGASGIESRVASCKRARRMVRAVERGHRRPWGYKCKGRDHSDDPRFIAHTDWRCKKGRSVVTWIAT